MPELSCMDRPEWWGLYGGVDELLEMRAKHSGKIGWDVSNVGLSEGPREVESVIMELLYLLMEFWECSQ